MIKSLVFIFLAVKIVQISNKPAFKPPIQLDYNKHDTDQRDDQIYTSFYDINDSYIDYNAFFDIPDEDLFIYTPNVTSKPVNKKLPDDDLFLRKFPKKPNEDVACSKMTRDFLEWSKKDEKERLNNCGRLMDLMRPVKKYLCSVESEVQILMEEAVETCPGEPAHILQGFLDNVVNSPTKMFVIKGEIPSRGEGRSLNGASDGPEKTIGKSYSSKIEDNDVVKVVVICTSVLVVCTVLV